MTDFLKEYINYVLIAICLYIILVIAFEYWRKFYKPITDKINELNNLNEKLNTYDANDIMEQYESFDQEMTENDLINITCNSYKKTFTSFTNVDNYT